MLEAGNYKARAIGGAFSKSKQKGTPAVGIQFQLSERQEKIWYVGYLSAGALQYTLKTLCTIGFDESQELIPDENGEARFGAGYFLNPDKEVELVVQHESYQDKMGNEKVRPRVAFVNEVGGASKFGAAPIEEVQSMLTSINFQAEMAAMRQTIGLFPAPADRVPTAPAAKPVSPKPAARPAAPAKPAQAAKPATAATRVAPKPVEPSFDESEEIPF